MPLFWLKFYHIHINHNWKRQLAIHGVLIHTWSETFINQPNKWLCVLSKLSFRSYSGLFAKRVQNVRRTTSERELFLIAQWEGRIHQFTKKKKSLFTQWLTYSEWPFSCVCWKVFPAFLVIHSLWCYQESILLEYIMLALCPLLHSTETPLTSFSSTLTDTNRYLFCWSF